MNQHGTEMGGQGYDGAKGGSGAHLLLIGVHTSMARVATPFERVFMANEGAAGVLRRASEALDGAAFATTAVGAIRLAVIEAAIEREFCKGI